MKPFTTEQFLTRAQKVWGDRWDYTRTHYRRMGQPITITCPEHGDFQQIPQGHLEGAVGCPGCKWRVYDLNSFKARSREVHGDRWDYSKTEYRGSGVPLTITCPEHGDFEQLPHEHIKGKTPCPWCSGKKVTTESVVSSSREVWGDRFDYTKTKYRNSVTKVTITCREHGDFEQFAYYHIRGFLGCTGCLGLVKDTESFIAKASLNTYRHGRDYSMSKYSGNQQPIRIKCEVHGEYTTIADYHIQGYETCPPCQARNVSKKEEDLASFIEGVVGNAEVRRNTRREIPPYELDVYVPSLRIAVEFNGLYWHSEQKKPRDYHYRKFAACQEAGIRLLQVWEDSWDMKGDIVREHLRQALHASTLPKISARNLQAVRVPTNIARNFLNTYHIQGFVGATHYFGLETSKGSLEALAAIKRQGSDYLLSRYATASQVRGGHSKLVAHIERTLEYDRLVTFADLSFSSGDLYRTTGWVEDKLIPPDYCYLVRNNTAREHKFKFRKSKFKNDPTLVFHDNLTERELAKMNNLLRLYDAGKLRFVKPHPSDTYQRK